MYIVFISENEAGKSNDGAHRHEKEYEESVCLGV